MIDELNKHLPMELSAHLRYSGQAQMLRFHGYNKLADKYTEEAEEELGHAHKLIYRIQQLDGAPNYLPDLVSDPIKKCDVPAMLAADLEVEQSVLDSLNALNTLAEGKAADWETSNVLRGLITDTEDHVTWLNTQLELIAELGKANYLQAQL